METPKRVAVYTCLRCGHEWAARKAGRPRICPNHKCQSPAWDRARPAYVERPLTYRRLYPELHGLQPGESCFLAFDENRTPGEPDPRPERVINYERKKHGKQFEVIPTTSGLNVRRLQ